MLKIMKIGEIIPSPTNPRQVLTPQDDEYQQIKKSIERFGIVEPLIINEVNNHCVSGNSRLTVLKDMGKEEVFCLMINEPDLNREIALTIALNKIKGKWDFEKLSTLFQSVQYEDIDVTGFYGDELERILGEAGAFIPPEDEGRDEDDDAPHEVNVAVKIGSYSFNMKKEDYIALVNGIRVENGFDDKLIIEELRRRLKRK